MSTHTRRSGEEQLSIRLAVRSIIDSAGSPSRTLKTPCATGSVTNPEGWLPLLLVPSFDHGLVVPHMMANLKLALPVNGTPLTLSCPW
ncbi:MAG: hypothetical protein IPP62_14955 [bacterium]|nr:hypothetical protein [bacterium]